MFKLYENYVPVEKLRSCRKVFKAAAVLAPGMHEIAAQQFVVGPFCGLDTSIPVDTHEYKYFFITIVMQTNQ